MNKKIIFVAPWGARMFICGNINDLVATLNAIRAGADYVHGATFATVLTSINNR